jgi:acetoin utilization deacetylase AcuC-like enzyme
VKIFYSDTFVLPLPPGHRFPMEKYARLRQRVLDAGVVPPCELLLPHAASDAELLAVHDAAYLRRVIEGKLAPAEIRRIGFPWSAAMVERSRRSVGATIEAGVAALHDGFAVNLAGGTHHAFADAGEGFCVFNDVAVAARALLDRGFVRQVAIVDGDVHQGNGTAAIFAGRPEVFTASVHGARNFPFRKERSDLDIELPDGAGDESFLSAFDRACAGALDVAPDIIFYVAGADPFAGDRLGRLAVTKGGLSLRDARLFDAAAEHGVPVAITMGGGYAANVADTVEIHLQTVLAAAARSGVSPISTTR